MANISEAWGTITITANNPDTVMVLNEILKKADTPDYGTFVGEGVGKIYYAGDGFYKGVTDFAGSGRWAYYTNIENFHFWNLENLDKNIKEFLTKEYFSILYEYEDFEPGVEMLAEQKVELIHKAGTPLEDLKVEELLYKDIDPTVKNYMMRGIVMGFYDLSPAMNENDIEWSMKEIEPVVLDTDNDFDYSKFDEDQFNEELKEFIEENYDGDLADLISKFSWLEEILD